MRNLDSGKVVHHIYAGWLGKLIGVRLGAPVEMWTSEQILEKYGMQKGYLVDYKEFAADDDTNGPTFFIRALADSGRYRDMTAEDVGQAWLNYSPWGKGMYWWGGYGISAEHTAYENLRAGVPAPLSGSIQMNGKELAQQIGGQIFSDAWGLVCPGKPGLASELSEKAAGVSHDGEGICGGRFVAACIAAAFTAETVAEMVEAGLREIPSDCMYAKVFADVKAFYDEKHGDWQSCLRMLRENYWRDKFGGGCHMIPNAGIMALALYYGQGDFDETLEICNRCGFDTDCNVGNLGAMMGVLTGLEGIADSWREPINDFYACSSVVGALNLQDAAGFALYLYGLCGKLGTCEVDDGILALPRINFYLPGSTHGIRVAQGGKEKAAYGLNKGGKLRIPLTPGETRVYVKTYMRPAEFADDRYTPSFSPALYPGQRITAKVAARGKVSARLYAVDGNHGQTHYSEAVSLQDGESATLSYTVPKLFGACLVQAGVAFEGGEEGILESLDFGGMADYVLDFSKERIEDWSFAHKAVSQCTNLKGYWNLLEGKLSGSCADLGECYTGSPEWTDGVFKCELTPVSGENHRFLFRVQGGARAYGAELNAQGLSLLKNSVRWETLKTVPFAWKKDKPVVLEVVLRHGHITVKADDTVLSYTDEQAPYLRGQIGFGVAAGSRCLFDQVCAAPLGREVPG